MTARTDFLAQAKPQQVETTKASGSSKKKNVQQLPAKRRKIAAKEALPVGPSAAPKPESQFKGKRKRAKLTIITEMPMDLLFEIFGFLHPLDLLHLARANKVIRGVVMSRQAQGVWKSAFQTEEVLAHPPPPPPGSISLPQYTALLYDQHCQVCSSRFGNMVHWLACIRFCAKCIDKRFLRKTDLEYESSWLCSYQQFHKARVPRSYDSGHITLKAEYHSRKQELDALLRDGNEAQAQELRARWRQESSNADTVIMPYLNWQRFVKQQGSRSRQQKRLARRNAIDTKVRAEGYTDREVGMWLGRFGLPAYKKLVLFTDKEWIKVKDDVLPVFAYRRQRSERDELLTRYQRETGVLHGWLQKTYCEFSLVPFLVPTTADIAKSEPFRTLIQNAAVKDEPLREPRMHAYKTNIPEIITTWKTSAEQQLINLLPAPPKRSKLAGEDRLSLATTFFKCHWCTEPIAYPRILMHSCLRSRRIQVDEHECDDHDDDDDDDDHDDAHDNEDEESVLEGSDTQYQSPRIFIDSSPEAMWKAMSSWCGSQWNEDGEQITFDEEASRVAQNIVRACGYSPESTEMSKMDESDIRVECTKCTKASRKPQRLVMTWKQAILHDIKKHFEEDSSPSGWKVVIDEDVLTTVREKEQAHKKPQGSLYICTACSHSRQDFVCRGHLINTHQIPKENLPKDSWEFLQTYYTPDLDQSIIKSSPLPVRL